MLHYASSTKGFYDANVFREGIPADAVKISREQYERAVAWQSEGGIIEGVTPQGEMILAAAKELSGDELARQVRGRRNDLLRNSDWTQLPDVPVTTAATWLTYRQRLRELPEQPGFPLKIDWPVAPE